MTFGEALRVCRAIPLSETESEQLVIGAHRRATGESLSRADFFSRLHAEFSDSSLKLLKTFSEECARGVPLQHVLGYQAFMHHEYEVNASTLIPRPETEVLVDVAISRLSDPAHGIEIGIGSGVIAIELLSTFEKLRMTASELSSQAVGLATKNATQILGSSERLEIRQPSSSNDVLGAFAGLHVDFIISNPPYLDPGASTEVETEVLNHEPRAALFPDNGDPLHFYREISNGARTFLKPGGKIFLEIASERSAETEGLFKSQWRTTLVPDLTGRLRVLIAE